MANNYKIARRINLSFMGFMLVMCILGLIAAFVLRDRAEGALLYLMISLQILLSLTGALGAWFHEKICLIIYAAITILGLLSIAFVRAEVGSQVVGIIINIASSGVAIWQAVLISKGAHLNQHGDSAQNFQHDIKYSLEA